MLILVTGGRDWTDRTLISEALLDAQRSTEDQPGRRMALMSGACPKRRVGDSWGSADWHAEQVADGWGWLVLRRPAEWESGGNGAGFARNQAMVRECAEHLAAGVVVACRAFLVPCTESRCRRTDDHWSHGTDHCAHRAHEAGIPVAGVDRTGARWAVAGKALRQGGPWPVRWMPGPLGAVARIGHLSSLPPGPRHTRAPDAGAGAGALVRLPVAAQVLG